MRRMAVAATRSTMAVACCKGMHAGGVGFNRPQGAHALRCGLSCPMAYAAGLTQAAWMDR